MAAETARSIGGPLARGLLRLYVAVVGLFLLAPIVAITAGSLTTTQFVVFPPQGLTLRWYLRMFDREEMLASFILSLGIAAAAATVASLAGLLAGLALARYRTPLNRLLWLLVASPMMLPAVVLGFGFLQAYLPSSARPSRPTI